jgi:hypothetical protein
MLSYEAFLEELGTIVRAHPAWKWMKDGVGLRAYIPGEDYDFCPVTAVYYARTGRAVSVMDWEAVGLALGMERGDAERIVQEADGACIGTSRGPLAEAVGLAARGQGGQTDGQNHHD